MNLNKIEPCIDFVGKQIPDEKISFVLIAYQEVLENFLIRDDYREQLELWFMVLNEKR